MYIIKNAMKNLIRNKGRNILTGSILLVIIAATAVSLIINAATKTVIQDYKSRFGSEVIIQADNEARKKNGGILESIDAAHYLDFSKSDCLQSSFLEATYGAKSNKIHAVDEEKAAVTVNSDEWVQPTMRFKGYSDYSMADDFKKGLRQVTDGYFPKKPFECMLSKDLAELNEVKAGDTISLFGVRGDGKITEAKSFTVCGIYSDNTQATPGGFITSGSSENRRNEILVTYETVLQVSEFAKASGTYYLKEPSLLEKFQNEIKTKGLPNGWKITTDEASYNAIVKPVEGLGSITLIFMIVVLVIGGIILILLSSISIRERKYEVGVLRAMGMKKRKVMLGFIFEMLILTSICLCIGLSTGAIVSQPVANVILSQQVKSAEQQQVNSDGSITYNANGTKTGTSATPLSEIHVSLSSKAVLQLILIALLLAGVSSIISISYITKYEPMKILSERN